MVAAEREALTRGEKLMVALAVLLVLWVEEGQAVTEPPAWEGVPAPAVGEGSAEGEPVPAPPPAEGEGCKEGEPVDEAAALPDAAEGDAEALAGALPEGLLEGTREAEKGALGEREGLLAGVPDELREVERVTEEEALEDSLAKGDMKDCVGVGEGGGVGVGNWGTMMARIMLFWLSAMYRSPVSLLKAMWSGELKSASVPYPSREPDRPGAVIQALRPPPAYQRTTRVLRSMVRRMKL